MLCHDQGGYLRNEYAKWITRKPTKGWRDTSLRKVLGINMRILMAVTQHWVAETGRSLEHTTLQA